MKAELLLRRRVPITEVTFIELIAWRLPTPLKCSTHHFKYRFAYVVNDVCVLRYDNERGKGDHRHVGDIEKPYRFSDLATLIADFTKDVEGYEP